MSADNIDRRTVLRTGGAGLLATLGAGSAVGAPNRTGDAGGSGASRGPTVPVRGVNLVPRARPVDVRVDGRTVLSNVEFGEVTPYLPVPTGEHTVKLTAAGDSDVAVEKTVTLSEGSNPRTVAAVGRPSKRSASARVFVDGQSNHDTSTARVRVVHASPGAPSVTVSRNDTTLVDDVGFGEASDYVEVPAENYSQLPEGKYTASAGERSISVTVNDGSATEVASFAASLDGCSVYTLFVAGYLDGSKGEGPRKSKGEGVKNANRKGVRAGFRAVTALDDTGLEADYATKLSSDQSLATQNSRAQGWTVLDVRDDEIRFEAAASGLQNSTVGHIHVGGPDESGPHVVTLYEFAPEDASAKEAPTVEGTLGNGSFTADDLVGPLEGESLDALVEKIETGEAYVNFHTTAHPSGEIRGNF